jgi:2-polyprenyl-3-methyl-5-hydroxy-6-metoxy-1,4-benzoquinol methylase
MSEESARRYWNENIDRWGELYLDISHGHEQLNAPGWMRWIYSRTILRHEARLMAERYRLTIAFIERHVRPGMTVVDVGCGTGIFTVEMLKRGARVIAVDFAESALASTRALVEKTLSSADVDYRLIDVSETRLPDSDAVLAMGVTPYLTSIAPFYDNILPTTKLFYCLILDPRNWANRLRTMIPALNVRRMHWFAPEEIDSILARHRWRLVERAPFATGYLDLAERI